MNILAKLRTRISAETAAVFLAAAFGVALRVWCVYNVPTKQVFDFATFHELARNIFEGRGHTLDGAPMAWTGPAYPYALALFFRLCGNAAEITGKWFNVILSSATLVPAYFVYKKLLKGRKAAAAFVITALFPHYIAYCNVLGTEVFFVFLFMSLLFVQLYFPDKKAAWPVLGVLCAALALTKPFMLAYPVICACVRRTESGGVKKTLAFFGVVFVSMLIVISPWTYRNYRLFGRIIPVSYNMGYNMYVNGNASNTTGGWMDPAKVEKPAWVEEEMNAILRNGERSVKVAYDIEPLMRSEALKWIKGNPLEFAKLGLLRVQQTFFSGANDISLWAANEAVVYSPDSGRTEADFTRAKNTAEFLLNAVALTLNVFGIMFFFLKFKGYAAAFFATRLKLGALDGVVFINTAFFLVVTFFFEGQARYAYPSYIFMIAAFMEICAGTVKKG